jgi:hypothetical protein
MLSRVICIIHCSLLAVYWIFVRIPTEHKLFIIIKWTGISYNYIAYSACHVRATEPWVFDFVVNRRFVILKLL